MKNLRNYVVTCKNRTQANAAATFYSKFTGYPILKWPIGGITIVGIATGKDAVHIGGEKSDHETAIPFENLSDLLLDNEESVQLNEKHTAIVTPKEVRVGCQTFTHEAIVKLHAAVCRATE